MLDKLMNEVIKAIWGYLAIIVAIMIYALARRPESPEDRISRELRRKSEDQQPW